MFYLRFHARPRPAHPDASTVGGAFVGCWIERPTLQEAESVARIWLTSRLWRVDAREEAVPIQRSDYEQNTAGLEYFEQAEIDREVFVFDTYPVGRRRRKKKRRRRGGEE